MAAQIRPNRLEVSDRFPMLGFTIRTDGGPQRAEITVATDIALFRPENKARRTRANFYSSKADGPLMVPRGEAVYLVPPEVLARFIGADRLFVALATAPERNGTTYRVDVQPAEGSPYISLKNLTGRSLRRVRLLPNRQERTAGYGVSGAGKLEWAGDVAQPGLQPTGGPAPKSSQPPAPPSEVSDDHEYNDGFGEMQISSPPPAAPPAKARDVAPVAQSLDWSDLVIGSERTPVNPPSVSRLGSAEAALVQAALSVLAGPLAPLIMALPSAARAANVCIGVGPAVGAGLGAGISLGVGVVFAPDGGIGLYGAAEFQAGFLASISASGQFTVVRGGIENFNGWSLAATISGGEGVVGGASALFDPNGNFQGVSVQLGIGAGLTPLDFYIAVQRQVAFAASLAASPPPEGADEDAEHDIGGPLPDVPSLGQPQGYSHALSQAPEYPQASRFEPAASGNFRSLARPRTINRIVIHITDGGPNIDGPISWFKNPSAKVSAHYIVGQDGEVVQMVRHNDVAWHAGGANGDSIGIEHVANTRGLLPTDAQYCASAALISWLCDLFGIPKDRDHVLGHAEADTHTTHTACPNAVWDWTYCMDLVQNEYSRPRLESTASSFGTTALAGESFSLNWDVQLIPQRYGLSCWAAAASMVVGWLREQSLDESTIAELAGHEPNTGMSVSSDAFRAFAAAIGLVPEAPQSYAPEGFRRLLETNGPLFVGKQMGGGIPDSGHAVVVVGMYSDGTNAYVRIADPWDRVVGSPGAPGAYLNSHSTGSRYIMTYSDFVAEYEWIQAADNTRPDSNKVYPLQIMHSDGNQGRVPDYASPPTEYAQGLATRFKNATRPVSLGFRLPPPPAACFADAVQPARPNRRRMTGNNGSVSYQLDQYDGMKAPAGLAEVGAVAPVPGPTLDLSDWPYLDGPTARTYGAVRIDWFYQDGRVGNVAISVPNSRAGDGYSLAITATIADVPDHAEVAALRIRLSYEFNQANEPAQIAFIDIGLYGNGRYERKNYWELQEQAVTA